MRYLTLSLFFVLTINCTSETSQIQKEIVSPSGEKASLPRLFTDNTGTVFMSWVESKEKQTSLFYSSLINGSWTEPKMISESDSWFVNWADYPSVIAQNGEPLAAHWLRKVEGGTYAYNVEIASASNNWQRTTVPHNDDTATEHGFVSMVPASDSTFMSVWLDGRNTGGGGSHDNHNSESSLTNAMTLRSAILDTKLNIISESEIDNSVCDCCGTSTARLKDGFITVYRDRTEDEIRDIYVSKFKNGKWSNPIAVNNDNWEIAACPVNGPSIISNDDVVAVAWYTGADEIQKVKIALSNDQGDSFSEPVIVDNGNPLGRVDIDFMNNGNIIVSWLERNMEDRSKAYFMAKTFSKEGEFLKEIKLADMSSSRRSGFPQISSYNGKIIAAWTDLNETTYGIKTAILE